MARVLQPLPNPPPADSPWAPIEVARVKLGWSARKLSAEAHGKPSTHYGLLATRGNWESAGLDTLEKFIAALVRAGIPEAELRMAMPSNYPKGVPDVLLLLREPVREQAVASLVVKGRKPSRAIEAVLSINFEKPRGPGQVAPTADRVAFMADALIAADDARGETIGAPPSEDLDLDDPPGPGRKKRRKKKR